MPDGQACPSAPEVIFGLLHIACKSPLIILSYLRSHASLFLLPLSFIPFLPFDSSIRSAIPPRLVQLA